MTRARSEEMGRVVPGLPSGWAKVKLQISTKRNYMALFWFKKKNYELVYFASSLTQS